MFSQNRRWLVVMSASLLFFFSFMQLNIINAISTQLMRDFSMNSIRLASLSSMYFYTNFLLVIPAGLLLDRFSPRKLIIFAITISVLGTITFSQSQTFWQAAISRLAIGVGGAFCFLSCIRLASRWFPLKQISYVAGWLVTVAMLGGLMAQYPVTILSNQMGWRNTMLIIAALGIFCLIIIWLFVIDSPDQQETLKIKCVVPLKQSLRIVLSNPYNWLAGLYTALMNLPIFLLGALWGILFLVQMNHIPATTASLITTTLFLGTIVGSPLIGWAADKLMRRDTMMQFCALSSLFIISLLIYLPGLTPLTLGILFFFLGFLTSGQSLSYALVTAKNPPELTGTANSIISMTLIASGFIFQPLFGWLMQLCDKPILIKHNWIYSASDFHYAMLIMPFAFIMSLFIAWQVKNRPMKPCEEETN